MAGLFCDPNNLIDTGTAITPNVSATQSQISQVLPKFIEPCSNSMNPPYAEKKTSETNAKIPVGLTPLRKMNVQMNQNPKCTHLSK